MTVDSLIMLNKNASRNYKSIEGKENPNTSILNTLLKTKIKCTTIF